MGIKGLNKLMKTSSRRVKLSQLTGKTIAIDLMGYLHRAAHNPSKKGKNPHVRYFFEIIVTFAQNHITPMFVFDGPSDKSTKCALQERKQLRVNNLINILKLIQKAVKNAEVDVLLEKASTASVPGKTSTAPDVERMITPRVVAIGNQILKQLINPKEQDADQLDDNLELAEQLEKALKRVIQIDGQMFFDLFELFDLTQTSFEVADGEADILLAQMSRAEVIDGIMSDDMDMFTYGGKIVYRGFNTIDYFKTQEIAEYNLDEYLRSSKMTFKQFVDLCILCGSDYTRKEDLLKGVGPKTALKMITQHGSIEEALNNPKYRKMLPDPHTRFNYQECRDMFARSECVDSLLFTLSKPSVKDHDALITFLTEMSRYRKKTVQSKIEMINNPPELEEQIPAVVEKQARATRPTKPTRTTKTTIKSTVPAILSLQVPAKQKTTSKGGGLVEDTNMDMPEVERRLNPKTGKSQIRNPATGRWVNADGKLGQHVLGQLTT